MVPSLRKKARYMFKNAVFKLLLKLHLNFFHDRRNCQCGYDSHESWTNDEFAPPNQVTNAAIDASFYYKHGILTSVEKHRILEEDNPQDATPRTVITSHESQRIGGKCPLVAATLHNYNNSPIYRLPEENIATIFSHLDHNVLHHLCLRRVSRLFRRLCLKDMPIVNFHPFAPNPSQESLIYFNHVLKRDYQDWWSSPETRPYLRALRSRLRRDQLCENCQVYGYSTAALEQFRRSGVCKIEPVWTGCKFSAKNQQWVYMYCDACDRFHASRAFSRSQRYALPKGRVCIGREGVVRLCEHVAVSWADVERSLDQRCGRCHGLLDTDGARLLDISCFDATHKTACWGSVCNRWDMRPRIRLEHTVDGGPMFLVLTWTGHMTLDVNNESRFDSYDVRRMFEQHRRTGAAHYLLTGGQPHTALSPTEMRCFARPGCTCIGYAGLPDHPITGGFMDCLGSPKYHPHLIADADIITESVQVSLCSVSFPHSPDSTKSKTQCIITSYERRVPLGPWSRALSSTKSRPRYNPSHAWFHALDPDSYVLDDNKARHGNVWPAKCQVPSCGNYYRSFQATRCPETKDFV